MFLKLSETFKFFTRLGGKFSGLKSIRLGQFNSERPSSGSGSCRTTLKICTLSKSLCWENWICVCIFPINMFCIMQLTPKTGIGSRVCYILRYPNIRTLSVPWGQQRSALLKGVRFTFPFHPVVSISTMQHPIFPFYVGQFKLWIFLGVKKDLFWRPQHFLAHLAYIYVVSY